jgi:hypothetical protein
MGLDAIDRYDAFSGNPRQGERGGLLELGDVIQLIYGVMWWCNWWVTR